MLKTKDIMVEKRNGEYEPYDAVKIKKSIEFACAGQNVSALVLESTIDQHIKNKIKTSAIQDNVILGALRLASAQEPQWLNVAGRALAMQMWGDYALRGKTFHQIIQTNIRKGFYTADILNHYTKTEIDELGSVIEHDYDLMHSHSSLITVKKKYLGKYELNQHMHMVTAMRFGQKHPAENRMQFVRELYNELSNRRISLATPFMSNLRGGGNTSSCFIIAIEDDLDSIFDNVKRIGRVSKNGGGIGIFMGYIRAKGSNVGLSENAAGPVTQWVKIINDTLVAVNQGGKRAGAGTVALPIWHNDILDFLDMQTEHGDVRLKSYDVFPQVTIPDIFMERDEANRSFVTFCPFEVLKKLDIDIRGLYGKKFTEAYLKIEQAFYDGKLKVARENKARELMKIIMRSQFETGLPYLAFTDTINAKNPNAYHVDSYGIPCVNLCTESFSNVKPDVYGHVCNLCSINLSNIDNMEQLAKTSQLAATILDYGIDLTNSPDEITKRHNDEFRTIGVGQMGLHDYLAKNGKNFRSLDTIREIAEVIEYNCALASVDLAKRHGSFNAYPESKWANGEMTSMFKSHSTGLCDWDYLQSQIELHGIRNSQLTSPAPTTSTSIYQDCSATVLPVYSTFFAEENKNGALTVAAKYLADYPIAYSKTMAKHTVTEIINAVAEVQKFTDTGISMEWLLDQNVEGFSAKTLYDAIHYAHMKELKAIYYVRTIKKNATVAVREEDACVACAG